MDSKKAIRNTIIYSDIFDYPLTFDQLYTFLISKKPFSRSTIQQSLASLPDILQKDGYYFLKGREYLVTKRKRYKKASGDKLRKAIRIAKILSFVPTVYFIGVSGGVAMQNAAEEDDIDFFVITKRNTVWMTRLVLLLLLSILGVLRTRQTKKIADAICLNMLLDETALSFPKNNQDIYIAHEIVQLYPVIQRNMMYQKFIQANKWIKKIMPHIEENKIALFSPQNIPVINPFFEWCMSFSFMESIAKFLQQQKMKKHRTKETIASSFIALHPRDYHQNTLRVYTSRI